MFLLVLLVPSFWIYSEHDVHAWKMSKWSACQKPFWNFGKLQWKFIIYRGIRNKIGQNKIGHLKYVDRMLRTSLLTDLLHNSTCLGTNSGRNNFFLFPTNMHEIHKMKLKNKIRKNPGGADNMLIYLLLLLFLLMIGAYFSNSQVIQ